MTKKEEILQVLASSLRQMLLRAEWEWDGVEEIRLRVNQPLAVTWKGQSWFVSSKGMLWEQWNGEKTKDLPLVTAQEIRETMDLLSSYSRYAFEDKIRQGFLTIRGGHRVGLAGRVILEYGDALGKVKTISPVTCINIRIARAVEGCARQILPYLWRKERDSGNETGVGQIYDTLLISPPAVGKTTLLRDLIRSLSYGGMTVGVVDERSELAACWQGIPQNDVGPRTDVLDGCPKASGMMMLVRTMSPQVIAVDEVGGEEDHKALEYVMCSGCGIVATIHGSSYEELLQRPVAGQWLKEERFGRYVFMEKEKAASGILYRYYICDRTGKLVKTVERKT